MLVGIPGSAVEVELGTRRSAWRRPARADPLTTFAKLFIYASLVFTLAYLYRFDYFELPRVERPALLLAAFPLAYLGFVFETTPKLA